MHASVLEWMAGVVEKHDLAREPVLEVGSLVVNGSPRGLFAGDYLGVDLRMGPGVDRVADAERLPWSDNVWPVVVCAEMLEHSLRPWRVVAELARVCRPGGSILVSARGFDEWGCWRFHGYPDDHWRLGREAFRLLFADCDLDVDVVTDPMGPGWFAHARKPERNLYARSVA